MLSSDNFPNYYDILEVSPKASQAVIRAAYKSLMQRYHPDKNAGNPDMAKHAVLIGQAFDVLSDPEKREAYDLELARHRSIESIPNEKQSHADDVAVTAQQREQPTEPRVHRPASPDNPPDVTPIYWLLGFLAVAVLILYAIGNTATQERQVAAQAESQKVTDSAREQQAKREAESAARAETERKREAESLIARTIPKLASGITVKMPPTKSGYGCTGYSESCTHYIKIPTIGVIIYRNSSEKIAQHIQKNKSLIIEAVVKKLGEHPYTELTQVNGEDLLKKIILEQINTTIVGYDNYRIADKSQYRGVEEVLLPDSFSVH